MTERERKIDSIIEKLSSYITRIRAKNRINLTDAAVLAEHEIMLLLNTIFGWDLINANIEKQNAAGIDLVDADRKIFVQVSTSDTRDKISDTFKRLEKLQDKYENYHLLFFFLSPDAKGLRNGKPYDGIPPFLSFVPKGEEAFDHNSDILDLMSITTRVPGLDPNKLSEVEKIVITLSERNRKRKAIVIALFFTLLLCLAFIGYGYAHFFDPDSNGFQSLNWSNSTKKTIRVCVATSSNMKNEYLALSDFEKKWNNATYHSGIDLDIQKYENFGSSMSSEDSKDGYLKMIESCDIFLVSLSTKVGKNVREEFEIALQHHREHQRPKILVYFKESGTEQETSELMAFKDYYYENCSQYLASYTNTEDLLLQFAIELQRELPSIDEQFKIDDGAITLNGIEVVSFDNLSFVVNNADYQKQVRKLSELENKIEKARKKCEKHPDDKDYRDDLQDLLNEYNELKEQLAADRQNIFILANRIANLQGQKVTQRMSRAIDAFNLGNVSEARIILDEAEYDLEVVLSSFHAQTAALEETRRALFLGIEELQLKINALMADINMPVSTRINKAFILWQQVDQTAQEAKYGEHEVEKYIKLLAYYFDFLEQYGKYEEALAIQTRLLSQRLSHYGEEHEKTAESYNDLGYLHDNLGHYPEAIAHLEKAISVKEKVLGTDHPSTATSYANIGSVYKSKGDYPKALEYYGKALGIKEKVLGADHSHTALSYNNIGGVYHSKGEYPKALEYYEKALGIYEKVLGTDHPATATSYHNIGGVYDDMGDYPKALEYYEKASGIREKVLGTDHPATATSYNNIGGVYKSMGDYPKALEYYEKALGILEKVLGAEHPHTATSYNNIGGVYYSMGEYPKALEYYEKDLAICEKVLGAEHPDTATSYHNIGVLYYEMGEYSKAMGYLEKDLAICEKVLGAEHPHTASSYNNIGLVYCSKGEYPKALEYYGKALGIFEKVLGTDHPDTATSYNNIGSVYDSMGDYLKALEYLGKALGIREKVLGIDHPDTATSYNNIGGVYVKMGEFLKAMEYLEKALAIFEKTLGAEHPDTKDLIKSIPMLEQLIEMTQGMTPEQIRERKQIL